MIVRYFIEHAFCICLHITSVYLCIRMSNIFLPIVHILTFPILSYPILSYPILAQPILSYPNASITSTSQSYPILSILSLSYPIFFSKFRARYAIEHIRYSSGR